MCRAADGISQQQLNGRGKFFVIARCDQNGLPTVTQHLCRTAGRCRNNWKTAGCGLKKRPAKRLLMGRMNENICGIHQISNVFTIAGEMQML